VKRNGERSRMGNWKESERGSVKRTGKLGSGKLGGKWGREVEVEVEIGSEKGRGKMSGIVRGSSKCRVARKWKCEGRVEGNKIEKGHVRGKCSVSLWRPQKVDKRMVLEYTHGLFIT
jgi:hypothetical protein